MTYEDALNYTSLQTAIGKPAEIPCKMVGEYAYADADTTFVADWDLVCDNAIQRTTAQVAISLGKFFGSFSFGVFSDKWVYVVYCRCFRNVYMYAFTLFRRFGRKTAFTLGAAFFIVSSLLCTFSPWYQLFLVGRFGLGAASSGLFYPAFAMSTYIFCVCLYCVLF